MENVISVPNWNDNTRKIPDDKQHKIGETVTRDHQALIYDKDLQILLEKFYFYFSVTPVYIDSNYHSMAIKSTKLMDRIFDKENRKF